MRKRCGQAAPGKARGIERGSALNAVTRIAVVAEVESEEQAR